MEVLSRNNKYEVQACDRGSGCSQIMAVRDIPMHNVVAGQMGGHFSFQDAIKVTGVLQTYDSCWVARGARIESKNVRVMNNAYVGKNVHLYGDTFIGGNAKLVGTTLHQITILSEYITGDADINIDTIQANQTGWYRLPMFDYRGFSPKPIAIYRGGQWRILSGCQDLSIESALRHWDPDRYSHAPERGQLYVDSIRWLQEQVTRYPMPSSEPEPEPVPEVAKGPAVKASHVAELTLVCSVCDDSHTYFIRP